MTGCPVGIVVGCDISVSVVSVEPRIEQTHIGVQFQGVFQRSHVDPISDCNGIDEEFATLEIRIHQPTVVSVEIGVCKSGHREYSYLFLSVGCRQFVINLTGYRLVALAEICEALS